MTCELKWLMLCGALAAGEALGYFAAPMAVLWPLVLSGVALTALFGFALRWRFWLPVAVFATGFALSLRAAEARQTVLDEMLVLHAGQPHVAELVVECAPYLRSGTNDTSWASFPSRIGPLPVRVMCPCAPADPPAAGERWRCAGWLSRRPEEPSGRYVFWVKGRNTFARRTADGATGPSALRHRVKEDVSSRLGIGLAGAATLADLHRAILLGERSRLARPLKEDFVAAGTIHIFAISGLHVVIIAKVLSFVLALTRLPVRVSGLVLVPLLWGYAFLVGLPASAVRATAMLSLCHLAPLAWRRPNGVMAWALTFLAVYGLSPERIRDVGCWLSFAVMLVLVLWGRWGVSTGSRIKDMLVFTLAAWMASLPIAAHVFGRITPGGLLANVLVAPLATGSVAGSAAGVMASFVSEDLARVVNNLTALFTELMLDLSRVVAAIPGSSFAVEAWSLGACLLWYVGLLAGLVALRRWRNRAVI